MVTIFAKGFEYDELLIMPLGMVKLVVEHELAKYFVTVSSD